jgi:hypothetical protein
MATVALIVVKLLYLLKQKIDPHIFHAVEVFGTLLRFPTLNTRFERVYKSRVFATNFEHMLQTVSALERIGKEFKSVGIIRRLSTSAV